MKILHVIPTLSAGGAETFVANLGVSLSALGASVKIFLMAGLRGARGHFLKLELENAGVPVLGATPHNVRSPVNLLQLMNVIRTWRPDIVHSHLFAADFTVAMLSFLTRDCESYFRTLHSTEICGDRSEKIVRLIDRRFSITIACSSSVAASHRSFMQDNQRSEVLTINNGTLMKEFNTSRKDKLNSRISLNIPNDAFVITHIGRMGGGGKYARLKTEPKAHDVVLKAFKKAFSKMNNCVLSLVGDGPLMTEAEELSKSLGISKQTIFLGVQKDPWQALEASDLFFLPSRYEGLPLVLLEAASCGLPVLASDLDVIRNMYHDNSWLLRKVDDVDGFAEGLLTIYENIDKFTNHAQNQSSIFRDEYSMMKCAKNYYDAYSTVMLHTE